MKTIVSQSRGTVGEKTFAAEPTTVFKELNADPSQPHVSAVAAIVGDSAPSVRTDESLIAAYQGGDRSSFTELVSRYERELFHFLVRF